MDNADFCPSFLQDVALAYVDKLYANGGGPSVVLPIEQLKAVIPLSKQLCTEQWIA